MRVYSIKAENYRPFASLEEIKFGPLATIVGSNDTGKSNILRAIELFFQHGTSPKIVETDVHDKAAPDADVIIELALTALPDEIELEENVKTSFQDEMLVDGDGNLRIRKVYPRDNLTKYEITLIAEDFVDDEFSRLVTKKESELNKSGDTLKLGFKKAGKGITNKNKRDAIRDYALKNEIPTETIEFPLAKNSDLWKTIISLLPEFKLFETDTRLDVSETKFQSEFREIIKTAAEDPTVQAAKTEFTGAIGTALQKEVIGIYERLKRHTDAFEGLTAKPIFSWDKAVSLDIFGRDTHGVETSLDQRGSGIRRLLMVAFFQYLADKAVEGDSKFIYGVEEPENCLHPGLQRELVRSFRQLVNAGYQIILTSHSPVFAGESPIGDLLLVTRSSGVASAKQHPDFEYVDIARELGVEPSDQITGYKACVFTEGPKDIYFLNTVAQKLKASGRIESDFDDLDIGFVPCGGETLKHWIDLEAMSKINRRFGVVVDSDRKTDAHVVPGRKMNWKRNCEGHGGLFYILRKREIENYLHPEAIRRSGIEPVEFDDFTDMKATFGENIYKAVEDMSCEEILAMDIYEEDHDEHHELLEIVRSFLELVSS